MISPLEALEIIDKVANLHDDATITAGTAAIYFGVSEKTLLRWRQAGEGPDYIQYPTGNTTARNQKVHYKMGDIRAWRESKKVTSTLEAAQIRGLAFLSLMDVEPFFMRDGRVISHALELPKDKFISSLNDDVEWISVYEAMQHPWGDEQEMMPFVARYKHVLDEEMERMNAFERVNVLGAAVKEAPAAHMEKSRDKL